MFCALVVGNAVVNIGSSSPSPGARLSGGLSHSGRVQSISRHAEMDALKYLRNHDVRKARLVVVRMLEGGQKFGESRPCIHCIQRIKRHHANISCVTFFEHGEWITETPSVCLLSSRLSSAERGERGER
uniref:CMP/dCMP-type deaminase domain-containing protein n=1 Tax=Pseudictyota dubia TaxID=2749911 RepID=A0A7R9W5L7_9STRA|mmetsp:Transcript_34153/g.63183  ORF Transcript_34153/g.63183 Transcript_34153/m.63183 type:complete len:129 (+) Transcript_34153:3-389(+)